MAKNDISPDGWLHHAHAQDEAAMQAHQEADFLLLQRFPGAEEALRAAAEHHRNAAALIRAWVKKEQDK